MPGLMAMFGAENPGHRYLRGGLELTRTRMVAELISGSAAIDLMLTAIPDRPVALGMATLALQRFLEQVGLPSRPGQPLGAVPGR